MAARLAWVPERQDIIWIDCNPQNGREMRDVHPMLVLSPRAFNEKTNLLVGLPMTTTAYKANKPFAVTIKGASGGKTGKTAYVLCHQPKSFDWRLRGAKPHPQKRMDDQTNAHSCAILNQIIAVA